MLSDRIVSLRKTAGLSQSQLAESLNISASAVGMYEQGRRVPSLDMLILLSNMFDVSLDYLISGVEHNSSSHSDKSSRVDCPCSTCYWKNYKRI